MAELKQLYGALSDDMRAGVMTTGDEGAAMAFELADAAWKKRMTSIEMVERVVNLRGGPEKVYSTIMSGTKEGATLLREIYQKLDNNAADALTGSFIRRMGHATPGQQTAAGDAFSLNTYLTNWNKVSLEAKGVMLGNRPEVVRATDAIARVAEKHKADMQKYQNLSGTSSNLINTGGLIGTGMLLSQGRYGLAATIMAVPVLSNMTGKLMTNQKFVSWLAKNADTPANALPKVANQLRAMAEKTEDGELLEFANVLLQGGVPQEVQE